MGGDRDSGNSLLAENDMFKHHFLVVVAVGSSVPLDLTDSTFVCLSHLIQLS
jgi:hypothetical protein